MDDTYIFNALTKEVHFKALGNHFVMKPQQIKRFNKEIGDFIAKEKGYLGLVALNEKFDEPDYKSSEEGRAFLEERRKEGVARRVQHLQMIVDNLQVSLQRDLSQADIKVDVLTQATAGEISAMQEMRDLQREGKDKDKKKLEELRRLQRELKADSTALANKAQGN